MTFSNLTSSISKKEPIPLTLKESGALPIASKKTVATLEAGALLAGTRNEYIGLLDVTDPEERYLMDNLYLVSRRINLFCVNVNCDLPEPIKYLF